jgi:hypothetical protein
MVRATHTAACASCTRRACAAMGGGVLCVCVAECDGGRAGHTCRVTVALFLRPTCAHSSPSPAPGGVVAGAQCVRHGGSARQVLAVVSPPGSVYSAGLVAAAAVPLRPR